MRFGILRMAWRNVLRNPRRTAIVTAAVTVGIAGTALTMGLNNGMVVQMVETAIATELGHLQVHATGYRRDPGLAHRLDDGGRAAGAALEAAEAVEAWSRRLRHDGLVSSPRASAGVRVVGIEPGAEARVSRVADSIVAGEYLDGDARRALLGSALAERLHVEVGDKIVLSVQDAAGDLTGGAFRVGGLFRTASRDFDRGTVFLPLGSVQGLLGVGDDVSEVVAVARERGDVDALRDALRRRLGERAEVETWEDLQPMLVAMIDAMDQTAWYVYAAVFVAMAFGIANVLMMAVYERMREIGVMMALGLRPARLVVGIAAESAILTGAGLALGFGLAGLGVAAMGEGIDLSAFSEGLESFGVGTRIRPVLRWRDVGVPCAVAVITALLASLWPALHAARLRPAEALRRT